MGEGSPELSDDLIANFCAVTGGDDQTARHFLSAAAGDLESAVSLFLDGGSGGVGLDNQPPQVEEEVRAPIQPRRAVLVDEEDTSYSSSNYPRIPPTAFGTFPPTEPFRDFRSEFAPFGDESTERGRRLAELFRPPTAIMFPGSFDLARRKAKEELCWLLVTVHNPIEFPCQQMVRDVWNDAAIQDFVREELVFMFLTIGTAEAERYQQYYPFTGFPHWALIDPRTGKRVKSGDRTIKAPEMLMELVEYVSEHPLQSPKRPNPIDVEALQIEEDEEGGLNKSPKKSPMEVPETVSAGKMHSPPMMPVEPSTDHPDAITIQFRLPNGTRQRRRFIVSDHVKVLFDFVQNVDPTLEEFDIQAHTKSLSGHLQEPLSAHDLKNAALTVVLQQEK
jgi:hypothetical protein